MFTEPHIQGNKKGWIEVICGPMFSGKTEELIRRIRRAQIADMKVAIFKPVIDSRYHSTDIVSHNDTNISALPVETSPEIITLAAGSEVVAIDEAQFFDAALTSVCEALALSGTRVILAGLDTDFQGKPFGPMPHLLCIAEHITKLKAICVKCGDPASRTFRKNASAETLLLGSQDLYEARCRSCFSKG